MSKTTDRLWTPIALLVAAALAACAGNGQWLNSDRIRQAFGSYGVDIIYADDERRISSLYSEEAGNRVMRTYAVVNFQGRPPAALAREHEKILGGASIGSTFRRAGWTIEKHHTYIGAFEVPESYTLIAEGMQIALPQELATHSYLFVVRRDERSYTYATITEVHHPDYLAAERLREIYGEILFDDGRRRLADLIGAPISLK